MRRLSKAEAARYARFKRPQRQQQYLLGRMLLRHAVACATAVAPQDIGTIEQPDSAPLLVLPENEPHPAFSLSHSRHWIACVVGSSPSLGVDIEVIDARRNVLALSEAAFDTSEHDFIRKHGESERVLAFYRIWTMKEALFKLWSSAGRQDKPPAVINAEGELQLQGDGWTCAFLEHPHLAIAVCSALPLVEITRSELLAFSF
ncbi:4'-phosphopantetheinyl transferase family protein [Noviherbaspirillum sedimenti]|uniref:4'-phosphopantetheinyl transferase family protein n=1 Tax=Noviherbaspirillum sedimenti TaxID=2320865 RepID=UPI0013141752|nr:4'-phosphopantetheinyl transferase superfamily protein [Noviherbaspirillum sedimenti]